MGSIITKAKSKAQPQAKPQAKSKAQPQAKPQAKSKAQPQAKPQAKPQAQHFYSPAVKMGASPYSAIKLAGGSTRHEAAYTLASLIASGMLASDADGNVASAPASDAHPSTLRALVTPAVVAYHTRQGRFDEKGMLTQTGIATFVGRLTGDGLRQFRSSASIVAAMMAAIKTGRPFVLESGKEIGFKTEVASS